VGEVPSFSTLAIHRSIDLLAEDNTIEPLYDLSEADFQVIRTVYIDPSRADMLHLSPEELPELCLFVLF
jgi:hypothetical protein